MERLSEDNQFGMADDVEAEVIRDGKIVNKMKFSLASTDIIGGAYILADPADKVVRNGRTVIDNQVDAIDGVNMSDSVEAGVV
jgi:hypothetical protein